LKSPTRRRARIRPQEAEGGYTLIEALAALAVTAAALAVIGQLGFVTVAAARRAEMRLLLTAAARQAFAALPGTQAVGEGAWTGDLDGAAWRLQYAPFAYPVHGAPSSSVWAPQALRLVVTNASGAKVVVDTVRLRPTGPPR
jgi:type II secretory pathway pseudopilin PulG